MHDDRVRRADIFASLALAIDLGLGVPEQTVMRTAIIAARLAAAAGLPAAEISAAWTIGLLRYIGCSTTSHDTSFMIDELALGGLLVCDDAEVMPLFRQVLAAGKPAAEAQAAIDRAFAAMAAGWFVDNHSQHCEAAQLFARRLGLDPMVEAGLAHAYERWDGHSSLRRADGEAISLPMRVAHVAEFAAYNAPRQHPAAIAEGIRRRAGSKFDPALCAVFASDPAGLLDGLAGGDLTLACLESEPGGPVWLDGDGIDLCLTAVADFGDFKSPHMRGHSRRVADIAAAAAAAASLPAADTAEVRRAGLVHDIGRIGLHAQLLCREGALGRADRERIRLHSYLTGRIFAESPALREVGALGSAHHERQDGSGYHRGLAAPALSARARILAAANAWCALTEPRPHRPQMTADEAAGELARQVRGGELDARAVDAVLTVAGRKGPNSRRSASLTLSEREIEVLERLAREETNAQIAERFGLSPKTVERHVTNIYDKIGVATRAGAALYAMEHGLV
jgi:HD-GYP domain-containing protein (c-di-GMP phosphodiesterase class II)